MAEFAEVIDVDGDRVSELAYGGTSVNELFVQLAVWTEDRLVTVSESGAPLTLHDRFDAPRLAYGCAYLNGIRHLVEVAVDETGWSRTWYQLDGSEAKSVHSDQGQINEPVDQLVAGLRASCNPVGPSPGLRPD
jgi:hypothetical protein